MEAAAVKEKAGASQADFAEQKRALESVIPEGDPDQGNGGEERKGQKEKGEASRDT